MYVQRRHLRRRSKKRLSSQAKPKRAGPTAAHRRRTACHKFEHTLSNQNQISLHLVYSANQGLAEDNEIHATFRLER
ncbi:hypothetical protein C6A77_23220 [Pseudomonas sp. AFG_SD02_1510_Pfu_092]|nr:hypothetical protein C6A77_23220 [Pseudomonas sp. AFG_SD02_1510_Pfu_092]